MSEVFSQSTVEAVGAVLNDASRAMHERFRALFTLRGIGSREAVEQITRCFSDPSALLKHECAYCLGQIGDPVALPALMDVLGDLRQEAMVRHEAGEALGAIGDPRAREILEKYSTDVTPEVSETCQIALDRLKWLEDKDGGRFVDSNPYFSVDPAPPVTIGNVSEWEKQLTDPSLSLFDRYRALFALRNHGSKESALALVSGFRDSSVLFKHEVAYVLGQMKEPAAVPGLTHQLQDLSENPMVRHECAEALGSIATKECLATLETFLGDRERVVRESCEVALDMVTHERSSDFQYANTVSQVAAVTS